MVWVGMLNRNTCREMSNWRRISRSLYTTLILFMAIRIQEKYSPIQLYPSCLSIDTAQTCVLIILSHCYWSRIPNINANVSLQFLEHDSLPLRCILFTFLPKQLQPLRLSNFSSLISRSMEQLLKSDWRQWREEDFLTWDDEPKWRRMARR